MYIELAGKEKICPPEQSLPELQVGMRSNLRVCRVEKCRGLHLPKHDSVLEAVPRGCFLCRPLCLFTVAFVEKTIEKVFIPRDLLGVILE